MYSNIKDCVSKTQVGLVEINVSLIKNNQNDVAQSVISYSILKTTFYLLRRLRNSLLSSISSLTFPSFH